MAQQNLIRKQYLMSGQNIAKVERLAKKTGTSSAQIVRLAVEAYEPDKSAQKEESDLIELVSSRLKEAIADTKKTRTRLDKALSKLEQ